MTVSYDLPDNFQPDPTLEALIPPPRDWRVYSRYPKGPEIAINLRTGEVFNHRSGNAVSVTISDEDNRGRFAYRAKKGHITTAAIAAGLHMARYGLPVRKNDEVHHRNGDVADNSLHNLEYLTPSTHTARHEALKFDRTGQTPGAKLEEATVRHILRLVYSPEELATDGAPMFRVPARESDTAAAHRRIAEQEWRKASASTAVAAISKGITNLLDWERKRSSLKRIKIEDFQIVQRILNGTTWKKEGVIQPDGTRPKPVATDEIDKILAQYGQLSRPCLDKSYAAVIEARTQATKAAEEAKKAAELDRWYDDHLRRKLTPEEDMAEYQREHEAMRATYGDEGDWELIEDEDGNVESVFVRDLLSQYFHIDFWIRQTERDTAAWRLANPEEAAEQYKAEISAEVDAELEQEAEQARAAKDKELEDFKTRLLQEKWATSLERKAAKKAFDAAYRAKIT